MLCRWKCTGSVQRAWGYTVAAVGHASMQCRQRGTGPSAHLRPGVGSQGSCNSHSGCRGNAHARHVFFFILSGWHLNTAGHDGFVVCTGIRCCVADLSIREEASPALCWSLRHGQPLFIFGTHRCSLYMTLNIRTGGIHIYQQISLWMRSIFISFRKFPSMEYLISTTFWLRVCAGLLALRTVAITSTFALGTSLAARSDTAHAAAHQICLQLWLASSLLADSLAVAAQTLLAQGIAAKDLGQARRVCPDPHASAAPLTACMFRIDSSCNIAFLACICCQHHVSLLPNSNGLPILHCHKAVCGI